MTAAPAWAVISPAGDLTWYPLAEEHDVRALVGGKVAPGALDTATVTLHGIPPGCGPLKVLASDIAMVFPDDYPPNPLAQNMLTALSGGRIVQPWRGYVALAEYEVDPDTREVLWPGEMSEHWQQRIREAASSQ
jgi:hypothetical protein